MLQKYRYNITEYGFTDYFNDVSNSGVARGYPERRLMMTSKQYIIISFLTTDMVIQFFIWMEDYRKKEEKKLLDAVKCNPVRMERRIEVIARYCLPQEQSVAGSTQLSVDLIDIERIDDVSSEEGGMVFVHWSRSGEYSSMSEL